jgi:hypothetical protein
MVLFRHHMQFCCIDGDDSLGIDGEFSEYIEEMKQHACETKGLLGRKPNNEMRKVCYQEIASRLDYRERRPLPNCVVRHVRMVYPDYEGKYMGYHAS